jgi:ssDNA-binding Zn-finger/Zn-ribbon topoisomerase 1
MQKQLKKIGAITRELQGNTCPSCGGQKYQLVLRAETQPQTGTLFARCSQCQRTRRVDEALTQILNVKAGKRGETTEAHTRSNRAKEAR